jgi:hypothetical protein
MKRLANFRGSLSSQCLCKIQLTWPFASGFKNMLCNFTTYISNPGLGRKLEDIHREESRWVSGRNFREPKMGMEKKDTLANDIP